MQLFVKVIALRPGTGEPGGEPRLLRCRPGVEPDTILSFLTRRLGEVIGTAWTSTGEHARLDVGWVFSGASATGSQEAADVACVPFIEAPGGSLQPLFGAQQGQRRPPARPADSRGLDAPVSQQARPAAAPGGQDTGTSGPPPAGPLGELDQALAAIARETGATLRVYPRPGRGARRIVLRNDRDDLGTRYQDAALEHDGTPTDHRPRPGAARQRVLG